MPNRMMTANDVAEQFAATCNGGEDELVAAIFERLRREHRTIQAHAIRAMMRVLKCVGEAEDWGTDLRNEGAVRFCRALALLEDMPHRSTMSRPLTAEEGDAVRIVGNGFAVW